MNRREVNRCTVRGCPVIGHWPQGAMCPMHAADAEDYYPPRRPSAEEMANNDVDL